VDIMSEPILEQRIDRLEEALAELARESAETERDWRRHRAESDRAWRQHRAEMRRLSAESQARSAEVQTRWEAENRRESAEWWARWDATVKDMRRESGELSRRLGTMAEDLVAPSVGHVLRTVIGASEDDVTSVAVRVRRRSPQRPGEMVEFDVVAVCGNYVLINETKGRLTPEHIPAFVKRLGTVRDFFPEYAGKRILGAMASLYVDESLVRLGERHGQIVLGFGQDLMDVLNAPGFVPREF
jgi:hypothetical protein